jgi:hypothetical protein
MFVFSHIGAVIKSTDLNPDEKRKYYVYLASALLGGMTAGAVISIAIGFSVASALHKLDDVANGVEIGEGISKSIAAIFVTTLTFKIPKWFGISAYEDDDASEDAPQNQKALSGPMTMSLSLFWNSWREFTEGGVLTALTVLLAENGNDTLGPFVGVGIAAAVVLGGGMAFGAHYVSARGFGVAAAIVSQFLAVGLITGAVRSFEEAYAVNHDDVTTPIIWNIDGSGGDVLGSFEFMGLSNEFTALALTTFIVSMVSISSYQIYHNYYGQSVIPRALRQQVGAMVSVRWGGNRHIDEGLGDLVEDRQLEILKVVA